MNLPGSRSDASGSPYAIAIIICYYGRKPWYLDIFIRSCAFNPTIDFFLITDWVDIKDCPPNVKLKSSTVNDLRQLAEDKLGVPVAVRESYKLCDLRPAFGVIFSDMLDNYHFWGYCDIDLLFGDIRYFITDALLAANDIISARKEYLTGFFSLYRNSEKINNIFRESADYRKVFGDRLYYCFDECNFQHDDLKKGRSVFEVNAEIQSMTYVVRKLALCGALSASFGHRIAEDSFGKLRWQQGTLTYDSTPVLLYHFIYFKDLAFIRVPKWNKIPDPLFIWSFFISAHSPRSLRGLLVYSRNFLQRLGKLVSFALVKRISLLVRSLSATKRLKAPGIPDVDSWLGYYKDENITVRIALSDQRVCALWEKGARSNKVFLSHLSGNTFLVRKFDQEINVEVEFGYEKDLNAQTICVRPFRRGQFFLYKLMDNGKNCDDPVLLR